MPVYNPPRFEPNYGNKYGFRQRDHAPSVAPINKPVPGTPTTTGTETTGSSTRPNQNYHSGPSAEDQVWTNSSDDPARDARTAASVGLGNDIGQMTPGQVAANLLGVVSPIPGVSMIANKLGLPGSLDDKLGTNIPEHQRYGAIGTVDAASGGVFDRTGQAFDPITGEGLGSYSSYGAAWDAPYAKGIRENPFSLDSWLSDPVNAPRNTAANAARARGSNAALGFNAALYGDRGLYADDGLGNVPTDAERARLAQHVGQTDYGFEAHTVAPDTATNEAIQGIGYTGSGAAPTGSQFSSTGTFSTQHSDSGDGGDHGPGGNPNSVSDAVTDDFADEDFGSYDDGGGGGGGK